MTVDDGQGLSPLFCLCVVARTHPSIASPKASPVTLHSPGRNWQPTSRGNNGGRCVVLLSIAVRLSFQFEIHSFPQEDGEEDAEQCDSYCGGPLEMDWEGNLVYDVYDAGGLVREVLILERATVELCRLMCTKMKSLVRIPFDVHKKEITHAHPISHVARTVGFPLGEFSALPRTKPEVGRLSRQFLYYLEAISRACGRFSVGWKGCGNIRARDPITPSAGDPLVVAKAT